MQFLETACNKAYTVASLTRTPDLMTSLNRLTDFQWQSLLDQDKQAGLALITDDIRKQYVAKYKIALRNQNYYAMNLLYEFAL